MTRTPRAVSPRARRRPALLQEGERQWRSASAARQVSTRLFDHIEPNITKLRSGITKPSYSARKGRSACRKEKRPTAKGGRILAGSTPVAKLPSPALLE